MQPSEAGGEAFFFKASAAPSVDKAYVMVHWKGQMLPNLIYRRAGTEG